MNKDVSWSMYNFRRKDKLNPIVVFLQYSGDKDKLKQIVESDPYYANMDEDAIEVAAEYMNIKSILNKVKINKEGKGNMCKAIQEMIDDGRTEGMQSILFAQIADGEITISSAAKRLNITEEEFEQKYKAYQLSDR